MTGRCRCSGMNAPRASRGILDQAHSVQSIFVETAGSWQPCPPRVSGLFVKQDQMKAQHPNSCFPRFGSTALPCLLYKWWSSWVVESYTRRVEEGSRRPDRIRDACEQATCIRAYTMLALASAPLDQPGTMLCSTEDVSIYSIGPSRV